MLNKKVLYIGNFSLPDLDAASIRVLGNCYNLKRAGCEVVLLEKQHLKKESVFKTKRIINGFVSYSSYIFDNKIKYYLHNEFFIKDVISVIEQEQVDIVIAYNYPSISLNKIRRYCKKRNIILISDCTEWYSTRNYKFPISLLCGIDTFYRMRIVNKKIKNIIVASSYLERYYKNCNTVRVPFLIDINEYSFKSPLLFDKSFINITYGGSLGGRKESLNEIISAINKSTNRDRIIFRITGITKEEYLQKHPKNAHLLNECNIIFYGKISRKKNLEIINSSDAFVFYRKKTRQNNAGFPTKFVESISLGVPVFTTDTSDIRMISEKNNLPVLFYESIEDLTRLFSLDSDLIKKMKTDFKKRDLFDFRTSDKLIEWMNNTLYK